MAAGVHSLAQAKEPQIDMSSAVTNSVSSLVQSLGEIPPEAVVFGYSEAMQALRDRLAVGGGQGYGDAWGSELS